MRYEVKRPFKLKPANKRYRQGDIFETNNTPLAEQLKEAGLLGRRLPDPKPVDPEPPPEKKEDESHDEPIHLGGGWYLTPDGRKVRKSQLEEE
jgi:hypothetical protein